MIYKKYKYDFGYFTMTNDEYIMLIDLLEENNPKHICELGAGQSTIIFEQYIKKNGGDFSSIEHDNKFCGDHTIQLKLIENTNIQIGAINYANINKYDGLENWLTYQDKFDFVFIDGPYGYDYRLNYNYGRVQLLSFAILDKLSDKSIVLIHDTERKNMKNTLNEFEKIIITNNFKFDKKIINKKPELTIYKIYKIYKD